MTIGTAIYACFVTGFVVYGICQLIDADRQRKWAEHNRRQILRRRFEHEMDKLREERAAEGYEHWGEVRVKVRRGRRAA